MVSLGREAVFIVVFFFGVKKTKKKQCNTGLIYCCLVIGNTEKQLLYSSLPSFIVAGDQSITPVPLGNNGSLRFVGLV